MAFTIGILAAFAAMLCWGTADFLAKGLCEKLGSYRSFLYSFIFSILPLLVYFFIAPHPAQISKGIVALFLAAGLVNFLGFLFLYKGLETEEISILSPIVACNPLITILASMAFLGEKLMLNQSVGALLAIASLVILSWETRKIKLNYKGILLGLGTMLCWGASTALLGITVKMTNWVLATLLFKVMTWLYGFALLSMFRVPLSFPQRRFFPVLALVGLVDLAGTVFFSYGTVTEFVSLMGSIANLYPAVTIILAAIFLKETLSRTQKLGVVGILLGLVLVSV